MSKIKFGNFITYKGKNLATPKAKAQNGNLVFAEIESGADKGYYIFGGVAGGHLVTYEVFNVLKEEVAALNTKVGDLSIGEGESKVTYKDVPAYVAAYVDSRLKALEAYKVKDVKVGDTSIVNENGVVTLGDAAQRDVAAEIVEGATGLATAGQVYDKVKAVQDAVNAIPEVVVAQGTGIAVGSTTAEGKTTYTVSVDETIATTKYVDDEIGKLGDVMSFIGVVSAVPTDKNVTLSDGKTVEAQKGDVITIASTDEKSGTEYVWTGSAWVEIGRVGVDEAVTSFGGVKGDITLGDGLSMVGQQLTVTFPDAPTADDLAYTHEYGATGVTSVKTALDDLYNGEQTTAESLTDLNYRLTDIESKYNVAANIGVTGIEGQTNVQGALEDLYSKVDNIEVPVTGVTGDTASYSDVTTNEAGNVTVKNTLATAVGVTGVTGATAATATGLATDAWVKDYITSILAWEVLAD